MLFDPARYYDPHRVRRGKTYSLAAGQLDDVYLFDAGFFGISPREAAQMDPQQKLMLQAAWEAMEDAGVNPGDIAGERTGVFVGSSVLENQSLYYYDPARASSPFMLGNTLCIIANRVSSFFDFRGPSLVVDTACSSGLYAFHLAAEAIRRDEIDTAIVGGVHIARTPGGYVGFSQARMLSPTGVCRAFDADADGYVRSEAAIAVVLQRSDLAARLGVRRRARVLATGINTDGATSQLAVPSAIQQERLIDTVLRHSQVDPDDFAFFEAHGTGTPVGDPIEAASIGNAIGKLRIDPLPIGSSKTNFGHSEPAAGLVGLAKVLLAFENRAIPASINFNSPNPSIDFDELNLRVNNALTPVAPEGTLIAGVNSFGFGGTNASVIVASEERTHWGSSDVRPEAGGGKWLLLSAASETSLRKLAQRWAERVEVAPAEELPVLIATAAARASFTQRIALPVGDDLASSLRDYAENGVPASGGLQGRVSFRRSTTIFACSGNGTQKAGMGQAEAEASPAFRQYFDEVARAFLEAGGEADLRALSADPELPAKLASPLVAQPILFGYQVALARTLCDEGFRPDVYVGHSVGEIAALHLAGYFDLDAAIRIILSRSRAFESLRGTGGMAAVAASEAEVRQALLELGRDDLVIAAINGPRSVTVSGSHDSLDRLARIRIAGKRLASVRLKVEIPYHSPLIDGLHDRFIKDISGIRFLKPTHPVASTVLGRIMGPYECDAHYLWRNARDPVRFSDAIVAISQQSPCHVVELSPTASFGSNIRDLVRLEALPVEYFSPVQGEGEFESFPRVAARAWANGIRIEPGALGGTCRGAAPDIPAYPWDEQYHHTSLSPDGLDAWGEGSLRYLTGLRAERSVPVWVTEFTPSAPAWLKDHQVGGTIVLPGTALVELAMAGARELWPDQPVELRNFDIVAAAVVEQDGIRVRTEIQAQTGEVTLWQRPRMTESEWTLLARGALRLGEGQGTRKVPPARVDAQGTEELYGFLKAQGLEYGPAFRRLTSVRRANGTTVWAHLSERAADGRFVLDPTGFDAALHALARIIPADLTSGPDQSLVLLPVHLDTAKLWRAGAEIAHARMELRKRRRHSVVVDLALFDGEWTCVAEIAGLEFSLVDLGAGGRIARLRTRRRLVRLRRPTEPVLVPRGWAKPAQALARMGFEAKAPAASPVAEAFGALRAALIGDGEKVPEALHRVLALAPNLANEARALMLEVRGADSLSGTLFGHAQGIIWDEAEAVVHRLLQGWRPGQRLNLLLCGISTPSLVKRLAAEERIDRLALTHPEPEGYRLLEQTLPDEYLPMLVAAPEADGYDVIVSGGCRAIEGEALAAGGLRLEFELPELRPGGSAGEMRGEHLHKAVDGLALRVAVSRGAGVGGLSSENEGALRAEIVGSAPGELEGALALAARALTPASPSEEAFSHRILFLPPLAERSLPEMICDILWQLRQAAGEDKSTPILLLGEAEHGAPEADLRGAALAAIVRTFRNELPQLACGGIMLSGLRHEQAPAFWRDLAEMALKHGIIWAGEDCWRTESYSCLEIGEQGGRRRLVQERSGHFESLTWQPARKPTLGAEEVEIEVAGTGLNFRDVMLARGLLPERLLDHGASGAALGMECAGKVVRVGARVDDIAPGTSVMGFAAEGFATHARMSRQALVPVPGGVDLAQAAAIPVTFLTAWYALVEVARIRPDDSVLIHGAAGGVGLAAIQVARLHGARVLATAGTAEKRAIACAYGAEDAFNSRDLDFVKAVADKTGGRGVNIVLNSLAKEAMHRSVECLAPFGTFLELGKRDYLEGSRLELRPFLNNLSYHGIDLDQVLIACPEVAQRIMQDVAAAFRAGKLKPLPVTCFAADDVAEAFQHMLAARHVGKIVVRPPGKTAARKAGHVGKNWVILGGTGGLGLALARALVTAGCDHVHLVSRSGTPNLGSGKDKDWARSSANVTFHAVDGSDAAALRKLLDRIEKACGPIDGVIHSAMTLRDRLISEIDKDEAAFVIASKLKVAETLDKVLRARAHQPKHVIFFSSIAAQIGNVGQAAYNAANAAIEALAARRRQDGLPGIALGWGPIGDAGYLARDASLAGKMARQQGINFQSVAEVVAEVLRVVRMPAAQDYCLSAVNWNRLGRQLSALRAPGFDPLVARGADERDGDKNLADDLRRLDWRDAIERARDEVGRILVKVLRIAPEQYDPSRSLALYGIDSLVAMELRLEIETRFGVPLPALAISRDITGSRLAVLIVENVRGHGEADGNG